MDIDKLNHLVIYKTVGVGGNSTYNVTLLDDARNGTTVAQIVVRWDAKTDEVRKMWDMLISGKAEIRL